MSKPEILAALKSLQATVDTHCLVINQFMNEFMVSLDTHFPITDDVRTPISLTLFQTSVTQPNSLPESLSPIHSSNQNNETHFSDLNPHNPSPNSYATRPTVPIDEESRSLTNSSPPIDSSDLLKSQSFGDLSEEFPPDLQGFSSDLQESLLDLKDSHLSPTPSTLPPSLPRSEHPWPPSCSRFQPPLPQTPPSPIPPQPTDPPPSDVLPLPATSPTNSSSTITDLLHGSLSQPTFQSKPIIKEFEFLPKSPPLINEINLEKSQFVNYVDSRFSDPHLNSHNPTPLPLEFSSDLHESLLDLKDSRSSPPTNIADSISVLSKPVPQPQKPSTSTPPLPIKRWNPKEIIVKQERWFCYNRDSRRSPLRRSHSRLHGLVDIEEWCKSSLPERVGCALSVFVHPSPQVMLGGEPPPILSLIWNQEHKRAVDVLGSFPHR